MDIFDKTIALEQAGGSIELAKDLFGMLIKELPILKNNLNTSFTGSANQAFWDAAHKIHGSTAYCGVPLLKSVSKQLEDAIKAGNPDDMRLALDEVNSAIDQIVAQGDTLLARF